MKESSLEKKLVTYAKSKGVLTYKWSSPAHRGVPDRIFIGKDRILFLEIKAPGKKPTELQLREMKLINEKGGTGERRVYRAEWTDDLEEGKLFISAWCE
jgi:hypothetical protein